uniref:TBD domain-containing protein n=1 Tax=Steinernema glaseri TaxID=37863 RepID=A0A1I7ZFV1_9BILA
MGPRTVTLIPKEFKLHESYHSSSQTPCYDHHYDEYLSKDSEVQKSLIVHVTRLCHVPQTQKHSETDGLVGDSRQPGSSDHPARLQSPHSGEPIPSTQDKYHSVARTKHAGAALEKPGSVSRTPADRGRLPGKDDEREAPPPPSSDLTVLWALARAEAPPGFGEHSGAGREGCSVWDQSDSRDPLHEPDVYSNGWTWTSKINFTLKKEIESHCLRPLDMIWSTPVLKVASKVGLQRSSS